MGAPAATPIGGRLLLAEATYERRLSSAAKFSGVIPQPSSSVPGGGAAGAGTGTAGAGARAGAGAGARRRFLFFAAVRFESETPIII